MDYADKHPMCDLWRVATITDEQLQLARESRVLSHPPGPPWEPAVAPRALLEAIEVMARNPPVAQQRAVFQALQDNVWNNTI